MLNKIKVQPIGLGTGLLLSCFALYLSLYFYTNIVGSLHQSYFQKFIKVDVLCNMLSEYGDSKFYNCNNQLQLSSTGKESKEEAIERTTVTPGEILKLLDAAKIEDARDYENPEDLLELKKNGAGSWLATVILTKKTKDSNIDLIKSLLNPINLSPVADPGKNCPEISEKKQVGTIFGLAMIISQTSGKTETTSACFANVHGNEYKIATLLASRATGYKLGENEKSEKLISYEQQANQSFFGIDTRYLPEFSLSKEVLDTSSIVKSAMNQYWHFYSDTTYQTDIGLTKDKDKKQITTETIYKHLYDTSKGGHYVPHSKVDMRDTQWYQENPAQLREALFKLSSFLITEINRDSGVKLARFQYQAIEGWIQYTIIFASMLILVILIWRFLGTVIKRPKNNKLFGKYFSIPMLYRGDILNETNEHQESKSFVDHSIGLLPYMGLFGTVIGILLGLPNAAAAITATGPSANESINELFVQLGLAFSTTGIAICAVIILETAWVIIQFREDVSLRALKKKLSEK